jgi:hypothetical protein
MELKKITHPNQFIKGKKYKSEAEVFTFSHLDKYEAMYFLDEGQGYIVHEGFIGFGSYSLTISDWYELEESTMELRIQIKTTEPEKQDLPMNMGSYMSEMYLVVLGEDRFFGNIYHQNKDDLTNLCKYMEAFAKHGEIIDYVKDMEPIEGVDEFKQIQSKLRELFK